MLFSKVLPYELKITVKSAHIHGGGLPHDSFVEVSVDGVLLETTESAPPPSEWNKLIIKKFSEIEPLTPIIISFSVYKKRWTSQGYKLVGTVSFPLSDLYSIINKGPTERVLELISNRRNVTLSGTLSLTLELVQEDTRRKSLAGLFSSSSKDEVTGTEVKISSETVTTTTSTVQNTTEIGDCKATKTLIKQIFEFDNYSFGLNTLAILILITSVFAYVQVTYISSANQKLESIDQLINSMESRIKQYVELQSRY